MNKKRKFKPGQGKTSQQYQDSTRFAWYGVVGMIIILILASLLTSCTGVYYLTDAEYSDARETHASVTYYNNSVYWGWNSGYFYYYGHPHYYPWYYYYNTCPPSHYSTTTHIIVNTHVDRPTHRPNRPKVNTHRSNIRVKTNTYRNTNVKTNVNRNKVNVKTNRSNNSYKRPTNTHRKPR
tara:strand:- start:314 stop:853 length:540 start_codon:yes stop_codon:yes gene_type:complete